MPFYICEKCAKKYEVTGESFSQLYCKECNGRLWYYENLRELYSETWESFELKKRNGINHPEKLKVSEPEIIESHVEPGNYRSPESESEIQDDSENYESSESEILETVVSGHLNILN